MERELEVGGFASESAMGDASSGNSTRLACREKSTNSLAHRKSSVPVKVEMESDLAESLSIILK
jgi:hypothetical protein